MLSVSKLARSRGLSRSTILYYESVGLLKAAARPRLACTYRNRGHQHAILKLLRNAKSFRSKNAMTKEKWVSIMKAAGFSEDDMRRWHVEFERSAPEDHGEFLEFLHIPPAEIAAIREWSRKKASPSA